MFYVLIVFIIGFIIFNKCRSLNLITRLSLVCIISVMLSYTVYTAIQHMDFEESGKLMSTMMVDTLNGSNYFRDPTYVGNDLNFLTYTSNGREYRLTDADGQLCFYPIPNEKQRIEKYIVVYKSSMMNIFFPRLRHEVYFKIYSTNI